MVIINDQVQVFSNLIFFYLLSCQKLINVGEMFCGCDLLFLVDGIFQFNLLCDGSCDGYIIDLVMVECIEVIYGVSVEYGLGVIGGIINFVICCLEGIDLCQYIGVGVSVFIDYEFDGLSYEIDYCLEGIYGDWDFLFGGVYKFRGLFYDVDGCVVGIDQVQGDIMDL